MVIGRLRARRGDPDPWTPLDEALDLARRTGGLAGAGRGRPCRGTLAGGRPCRGRTGEPDGALLLRAQADGWILGELWAWRRRAGIEDNAEPALVAEPFACELRGDWLTVAERWDGIGCPYEAAIARAGCPDDTVALSAPRRLPCRTCVARARRA